MDTALDTLRKCLIRVIRFNKKREIAADLYIWWDEEFDGWSTPGLKGTWNDTGFVSHLRREMNSTGRIRFMEGPKNSLYVYRSNGRLTLDGDDGADPDFVDGVEDALRVLLEEDIQRHIEQHKKFWHNRNSKEPCKDCHGTGKIQLLFSEVVCDCVKGST